MGLIDSLLRRGSGAAKPDASAKGKGAPRQPGATAGVAPARPAGAGRTGSDIADALRNDTIASEAGEGIVRPKVIETEQELAEAVTFAGLLVEKLGLGSHLYQHIAPLEIQRDSKVCVVLVTQQKRYSDELREVLKLLAQRGYKLRPGPHPNVFMVSSGLVLSVNKGDIDPLGLSTVKRLAGSKTDSALWSLFVDIVSWAFREKASDIHVNVYPQQERSQVKFTIGGKYVAPERWALPTSTLSQMLGVAWQKSKGGADTAFIPKQEQQCNIFLHIARTNERVMLRWASMATDDGPQVTMRLLQLDAMQNTITLEQLGYVPSQISMLNRAMKSEGGAIIFAGVVGSGKSTTIATVMGTIPNTRKVMTLEDPREYIIPNSHANTISRPLDGSGDDSFNAKLRTLKRSAFNDLLLGEIRDRETGIVFQDVVLSGQNLYSTTHAQRATGIPGKLASPMVGVERSVLATPNAMKLLVYQALLPVNCPDCKIRGDEMLEQPGGHEEYGPYLARIKRLYGFGGERVYFRNVNGCPKCRREGLPEINGFKGRTVVAEMIEPDEVMLEHIGSGDNLALNRYVASLPRTGYTDPNMDFKSSLECAIYKMSTGLIDPREIEPRFASFETIEIKRQNAQRLAEHQARASAASLQRRLRDEAKAAVRASDDHAPSALGALSD